MTDPAAGRFGLVGALAAFPRRLAAREVERRGGRLARGVTRATTHVVFGRSLLAAADAPAIEARLAAERTSGRRILSENGFLRLLGLVRRPAAAEFGRTSLLDQSGLAPQVFDLLALFDAFESDAEPYSFRDLILARKYAGLASGGASWRAIARTAHRAGGGAALTAQTLLTGRADEILSRCTLGLSDPDGQFRLDLDRPEDDGLEELFAAAEAAEAAGRHGDAAALYRRCLALDPGDAIAAFNRANCLRAGGHAAEAAHDYARAIKLDPGLVEAWFNLAGLMRDQGRPGSARRHLTKALALDPGYADAVFNLASLEYGAGDLAAARRWWLRYLELDSDSEWARTAARGVRYVDEQTARGSAG